MKIRRALMLSVSFAVFGGAPGQAFAQQAGEVLPAAAENEIIVTAQKRSERLQDVPASVDVVGGDEIEKLNLKTFADIEQLAPGLSLTSNEPASNSVTLRGVGFNPNSASAPTVDIYFNETPLDTGSAFRSMYDIGQIEVLRGPQGTLRGRTSPSGAITIATRRPDLDQANGFIQQSLSTQEGYNTQGAIGVPLVPGVLAIRVAGLFDRNIGAAVKNLSNGEEDSDRTESIRGSIAFRPSANLDVNLTYQYMNNRTLFNPLLFTLPGAVTDPILTPGDRRAKVQQPSRYRYRAHLVSLGLDWDLGDATLSYIGGYQNIRQARTADIAYGGTVPGYSQAQTNSIPTERVSQELRLASNGNNFWNYLLGGYFEDTRGVTRLAQTQVLGFGFVGGAPLPPLDFAVLNIDGRVPNKTRTWAAFTDHRFQILPSTQLQLGLRYQETQAERDFVLTLSGPALGPLPIVQSGISPENRDVTYRQLTGGASLKHDFSRDLTGYVSYGRSYRPGGVVLTTAALDEDLLVFDAETSNNYEIGLKGALADRRIQFTVAVYQQDLKNYLAYTGSYLSVSTAKDGTVDNNVAFTFNGDARVRGVEANISGEVVRGLTLGLNATYNDARFTNALAPCNDFNGDGVPDSVGAPSVPVGQNVSRCQLSGERLSDQADWGVSLNAEYRIAAGEGEAFVRGLAAYVPKRTDPYQDISYDDLLNNSVFLGYAGPNNSYEFSFFAKNLANVATLVSRNASQVDYDFFPTGYAFGTAVRPREFGIQARASF